MVLARQPKSAQSKHAKTGSSYQQDLSAAARSTHVGALLAGPLYARIVWLAVPRRGDNTADVDNVVKPILDALRGVVYADDSTVLRCSVARLDLADDTVVIGAGGEPHTGQSQLLSYLGRGHEDILYVEVGPTSAAEAVIGPVDGDTL